MLRCRVVREIRSGVAWMMDAGIWNTCLHLYQGFIVVAAELELDIFSKAVLML